MTGSKKRFAASYSGGKDSAFAVYCAMQAGYEPACLLTTYDAKNDHSWFHRIPQSLIGQAAESIGASFAIVKTEGERYAADFEKALRECKESQIEICVFGDIDIQEHFDWCEARCRNAGVKSYFPLWHKNRTDVVSAFIDSGFRALITAVNTASMDERYLGQTLSHELIAQIAADSVDVCGENGEYHTFVYDGPIFHRPLTLVRGQPGREGNRAWLPVAAK